MTTAPRHTASKGSAALGGAEIAKAALLTSTAVVVAAVAGALLAGVPGLLGAAAGGALVLGFFLCGALVVNVVAAVSPAASLLVALVTYLLQVVVLAAVFTGLRASGLLEESIDARWLGGSVIAAALVWTVAHIVAQVRSRQPLYDLPRRSPAGSTGGTEVSAR